MNLILVQSEVLKGGKSPLNMLQLIIKQLRKKGSAQREVSGPGLRKSKL